MQNNGKDKNLRPIAKHERDDNTLGVESSNGAIFDRGYWIFHFGYSLWLAFNEHCILIKRYVTFLFPFFSFFFFFGVYI